MLGSFPLNQLEQTPEICRMLTFHFVQSLRIMALTVFDASCLAKWCELGDDDSEACCDEGDDGMLASGSEAVEYLRAALRRPKGGRCPSRHPCGLSNLALASASASVTALLSIILSTIILTTNPEGGPLYRGLIALSS